MVVVGKPFAEILRIAADLHFSLIVMGIRGRHQGGIEEILRLDGGERLRAARIPVVFLNQRQTKEGPNDALRAIEWGGSGAPASIRAERFARKTAHPTWRRFARQFQSPLIYILLFALAADAAIWVSEGDGAAESESHSHRRHPLLNAGLGVYQESKSEAALARLKEMAAPMVWVMREGKLVHLPSADLVPGDVARIEAGDRVPADGGLIEAEG